MAEYTNEIVIARPVADVQAALDDPSLVPQWVTGLQSVEAVDGEFDAEGSHFRYHFSEGEMEFALDRKVESSDDSGRVVAFDSGMFNTKTEERLEAVNGGTRLVTRTEVTSEGPPLGDEMLEGMKARQAADFQRLKELLEGS